MSNQFIDKDDTLSTNKWRLAAGRVLNLILAHVKEIHQRLPQFDPIKVESGQRRIELQEHYGARVWTDVEADEYRRQTCMCHSCEHLKVGKRQGNCDIAQHLYDICTEQDVALSVTRCPVYKPKGDNGTKQTASNTV